MYSLTPKITTREISPQSSPPRVEKLLLHTASENVSPTGNNMSTAITRGKYSTNLLGKFLSINKPSNKTGNEQAVVLHNPSCPNIQPSSPPMHDATINPAIRPEGQKLVARMEIRLPKGAKKLINPPAVPLMRPSQTLAHAFTESASVDHGELYHRRAQHSGAPYGNSHHQADGISNDTPFQLRNRLSVKSSNSAGKRSTIMKVHLTQRMLFTAENQIKIVAKEWAAGNREAYSWWCWYLESYSKGQFNLTEIPTTRYSLTPGTYFPALFPTWEQDMVLESQKLEMIWSQWSEERKQPTEEILTSAVGRFGTSSMALSFFNESYEIIKVENGYNAKYIPRDASLAAHALLSKEVFTVLDTKEAFQFRDHPLVLNEPKIRFFAAAPLLSSNDVPIAVFSVWSKEPREVFTQTDKHDLSIYASVILQDLQHLADTLSGLDGRSTPLLQRDSIINGDYRKSMTAPSHISSTMKRLRPEPVQPLRFYKDQTPLVPPSSTFTSQQSKQELLCEQTPPSSAEPDQGPTFSNLQEGFGKNFKQLSVNLDVSSYPHLQDMITPESLAFDISRPFSGSDITSVYREPNNTPHNTPVGGEVADFLALSDSDVYEEHDYSEVCNTSRSIGEADDSHILDESVRFSEPKRVSADLNCSNSPDLGLTARNLAKISSSPLIDLLTPPQNLEVNAQAKKSRELRQTPTVPQSPLVLYSGDCCETRPLTCTEASSKLNEIVAEQLPGLSFTQSTIPSKVSLETVTTSPPDVDSFMARYAREFGYDKMYAVEMIPAKLDVSKEELYEPGGIKYNVLASCGPTSLDPRSLNHAFHVDCLKSRDYKFYSCKESNLTGIVFPYPKDTIVPETRIRGILFGAFKNGVWPMDPNTELTKLWKVMDALMEAITKASCTPVSRRSKMEPVTLKPFPAYEAREIGGDTHEHQPLDYGLDQASKCLHTQGDIISVQERRSSYEANWSQDQNGEDHIEDYTLAVNYFGQAYIKKNSHSRSGSDESRGSGQESHNQETQLRASQIRDAREAIAHARERMSVHNAQNFTSE